MFNTQFIQKYLVLQDGILSTHLLGYIIALAQALSERGEKGEKGGVFPFTY